MDKRTDVSDATEAVEQRDATAEKDAGRPPTPDEEAAAESNEPVDESVRRAHEDYLDKAKDVKGEGRIP